jgi:ATPase family AAA domain-containing protein 3A/B
MRVWCDRYSVDSAILDRMDEAVEFALPGKDERVRLLEQYFKERIVSPDGNARPIRLEDGVDSIDWSKMADVIDGFSGRQIMKMATAWQASAYASVDNTLTKKMVDFTVQDQCAQVKKKEVWAKTELNRTPGSK